MDEGWWDWRSVENQNWVCSPARMALSTVEAWAFRAEHPLSLMSLRYMFIQYNLRLVPILRQTHSTCTRSIIRDIQIDPENHIRELCHTTHSPNSSVWGNYHDTQTTNGFVYNSRYTAYLEGRRHPLLHQDENGAKHAEHSHKFINNSLPANFCKFNLDLLRNCRIWRRGWDIIGSRKTLSSLRFLSILVTNTEPTAVYLQ